MWYDSCFRCNKLTFTKCIPVYNVKKCQSSAILEEKK